MRAVDFTTVYIPSVTQGGIDDLVSQGYQHAIVGMDSASESVAVVRAFLDSGFSWDAYRIVRSDREPEPDVDDLRTGIVAVYATRHMLRDLPGYVCPDIERRPDIPSQAYIQRFVSRLAYWEIGPGYQVGVADYSGAWVWQEAGWGSWDWLKQQGHKLWMNAYQSPWAGWTWPDVIGYQTAYDQAETIGLVDYSTMRDRAVLLLGEGAF